MHSQAIIPGVPPCILHLAFKAVFLYIYFVQNKRMEKIMEKINVSTLRENLATYISKANSGQTITITSHGHELARLVPAEKRSETSKSKLKKLGETAVMDDILSPIGEAWEVGQ